MLSRKMYFLVLVLQFEPRTEQNRTNRTGSISSVLSSGSILAKDCQFSSQFSKKVEELN
jgi:hypothetical protein